MTTEPDDLTEVDPDASLPPANDPGGAHAKGYSADPKVKTSNVPDPIPLAEAPKGKHVHVPERDPWVHPTGRSEPETHADEPIIGTDL